MNGVVASVVAAVLVVALVLVGRLLDARRWRRELVVYRLRFPRGVRVEQLVAFLSSLPPAPKSLFANAPLLVEVGASHAGIEHRLGLPGSDADALRVQLETALPGLRVERLEGPVEALPVTRAVELQATSRGIPLADARVEASAAAVLASLQPLAEGELLQLQWLIRGAAVPPRIRPQTSRGLGSDQLGRPDRREQRDVERKHAELLLHVVGRIGVAAKNSGRRSQLLRRLRAALTVMDAPGMHVGTSPVPESVAARRLVRRTTPLLAWPMTLNTREAAGLLGVPLGPLDVPGLDLGGARQLSAHPGRLTSGTLVGASDHPGTFGRELRLAEDDRLRHLHLIGPTGTGKSTLMARMALDDLARGHGLVVVDPKRDLVEAILARLPAERAADVVVLDPTDTARPVGLNVLAREGDDEAERELLAEHLLGVFQSLWKDSWGPRSDDILRAGLLTLSSARAPDGTAFTLVELPELLTNAGFRKGVLAQPAVPPQVRGFWQWFDAASPWERNQAMAPVLNKVRAFTMRTPVRLLLGQPAGLDLGQLFDERRVLLVPLSAGELGKPAAELLGSLVVAAVWQTVRGRTRTPHDQRSSLFIYLDEFQDVLRLPLDLADLLAQARGLGAGLTLAHQHLGQLPKDVRAAVLSTARSQVVFQVSAEDARVLARGFDPSLGAEDLMGLDAWHFALRPVWQGQVIRPVTGRALPLELSTGGELLRQTSRERFGVSRAAVEEGIARRAGSGAVRPVIGRRKKAAGAS